MRYELPSVVLCAGLVSVTVALLATRVDAGPRRQESCAADIKLGAPGIDAGDTLGKSVAMDGDVLVVGAPTDEAGGSVKVFRRINGAYVFEATLKGSHTDAGDQFGAAVDVSGDSVIVGAPNDEQQGDDGTGTITIFRRINDVWTEEYFDMGPAGQIYLYGRSVQIVGDTAVVGHQFRSGGGVRVLERTGGTWTSTVSLPAGGIGDGYGEQVAFDGVTVASGSWVSPASGGYSEVGRVHTFRSNGSSWTEERPLFPPVLDSTLRFGAGVAVQGDRMVVGAGGDDSDGFLAGALYTYVRTGDSWVFEQKITPLDGGVSQELGYVLAIDDPWIVAGNPKYATAQTGANAGRILVFHRDADAWSQSQSFFPLGVGAQDTLGTAVAIAGGVIAGGAPSDDDLGNGAGIAWLRAVADTDCNRNGARDACDIAFDPALDCDHDGLLDSCEISGPFRVYTPTFSPINFGVVHTYMLEDTQRADGLVLLTCDGFALTGGDKVVHVRLNGVHVGSVFASYVVFNCSPVFGSMSIPASTFNSLTTPGTTTQFDFIASNTIPACSGSFLDVRIGYVAHSLADLDLDGVLDVCLSCLADLNSDGEVDGADLALLLGGWNLAQYDLNGDGVVNAIDLGILCGSWGPCITP